MVKDYLASSSKWFKEKGNDVWENMRESKSLALIIGLVAVLIAVLAWIDPGFWEGNPKPDVAMHFIYPQLPAIVLDNSSNVTAKDVKYTIVLWDTNLEQNDPLPIPISTFDFINPHNSGGPESIFSSQVISLLKPGDILIGSASVECPECKRGRTYIVYIDWGKGGWFSELTNKTDGAVVIPKMFSKEGLQNYYVSLSATPIGERRSIEVLQ